MLKDQRISFNSYKELADYIKSSNVIFVDILFCSPVGVWHHCTYASSYCTEDVLKLGFGFDASSIPLFRSLEYTDMLMVPDPKCCWLDPFRKHKTLNVLSNIVNYDGSPYECCPRSLLQMTEKLIQELSIGDYLAVGTEIEYFIFDHVHYNVSKSDISVSIYGDEYNTSKVSQKSQLHQNTTTNFRLDNDKMYHITSPKDQFCDFRSDALLLLNNVGRNVEKHHHEAGNCQNEIVCKFAPLVEAADNVMTCKYIIKNLAKLHGKSATFMPKPIVGEAGSGLHIHQSIWKNNQNLFYDSNSSHFNLSQLALYYIGGIFKHATALCALTNPSTNSYKRLIPGFEAPCKMVYSEANRSAAIRIPLMHKSNPTSKRLECRFPDATCCPYLAYAAIALAGIDGILNKIEAPKPLAENIYTLDSKEAEKITSTPLNLNAALDALQNDWQFLTRGNVFTESFIKKYIQYRREEFKSVEVIPHPKEFELYYGA